MINTDSRLFQKLTDSEYYLLSVLADYGKTSCPDNDVLMKRTNWGIQKLQATKKYLVSKGFLEIKGRTDKEKGGKTSNEYIIKTNLINKFNGKKNNENQVIENRIIEIQLFENRIVENQIVDNQLIENHTDLYLLREPFIKNIKELLKEREEKELALSLKDSEIENLKKQLESEKEKNKEKSCAKKESDKPRHKFPPTNGKPAAKLNPPKVEVPPHKTDIEQEKWKQPKPYEVDIQDYEFKVWSEKAKEEFFIFCESKYSTSNGKFSGTQARQIIKQIERDIFQYGIQKVENCLVLCNQRGWNYDIKYQINKESREKQDELKRNKQQADDPTISTVESAVRARFGDSFTENEHETGYNPLPMPWELEQEF